MKRILTFMLLACMVALLAGCGCKHEWSTSCTSPKTCTLCGETKGEAPGHSWQDATCLQPKTCSTCGEIEGEALGHDWDSMDCQKIRTCDRCGESTGTPGDHQMSWAPVLDDYTRMTTSCAVCGFTEEAPMDWEIVAMDLILGTWKNDTAQLEVLADGTATLTSNGETTQFRWNFKEVFQPYSGFNALMLKYEMPLDSSAQTIGSYNEASIMCTQNNPIELLFLQMTSIQDGFVQIELSR